MPSAVCFTGMFFFCIFKKVHIRYNLDNIDESVKKQRNKKDSFAKTYFFEFFCDYSTGFVSGVSLRLPSLWTNSYFVSTVGGAPLAVIKQYIENQKSV